MSESNANTEHFDVFLCHNSEDKPEIRQIADELSRRGLKPWLDEREIPPGALWQEVLEKQIKAIKAVAVFAGNSGMGHWQNEEMQACINQFRSRGCPVIPVILPSTTKTPQFPIFLQNRTYVDFREVDPDPFKQLIWGITGENPNYKKFNDSSRNELQTLREADGKDLLPSKTKQPVELRLPGNLDEFSSEKQIAFVQSLAYLLKIGEVKVIRVVEGSFRLYLELNQEDADKLYSAGKEGQLAELSISEVRLYPAIAVPPDQEQRAQLLILLDRVQEYWVDGVLKQSLYHEVLISLGKHAMDEAVEPPWKHIVAIPDQRRHLLLQDRNINTVFDATGLLLILGEPGSGKTTSLLELAAALIVRAKSDPKERVPIVLNLSSWKKHQSIEEWIACELSAKYRIPMSIAENWLSKDYLVPLLDGLDEVQTALQPECVAAINGFIESNKPFGLVVCCRLAEYQWLPDRLKLNGAVCLESLTVEDLDKFLEAGGPRLAGLQQALKSDPVLQELAATPLMLSIMSLACEGVEGEALSIHKDDSPKARRDQIFRLYIDRMFERRESSAKLFPKDKSISWLSWLARKMREQSRSMFMVEELQPSWLSTTGQREAYETVTALGVGLVGGLVIGLSGGRVTVGPIISGLIIGLAIGFLRMLGIVSMNEIHLVEAIRWEWKQFWKKMITGLIIASLVWLLILEIAWLLNGGGSWAGMGSVRYAANRAVRWAIRRNLSRAVQRVRQSG